MHISIVVLTFMGAVSVLGQDQRDNSRTTTPVPILRQINKVNEDGSYTYGYENGDGSYKIETKDKDGKVQGKYGYYDDAGTLKEVEYGASRAGFYPTGAGINAPEVAPPRNDINAPTDGSYDPELYTYPYQFGYEGPNGPAVPAEQGRRVRVKSGRKQQNSANGRQLSLFQQSQPQQQPQQQQYQQQAQQQQYQQQQYQQQQQQPQQQQYQQQPQQQYKPQQYQQQQQTQQQYQQPQQSPLPSYYQQQPQAPTFNPSQLFQGHPARNINLNTGSYSLNY